MEHVDQCLLCGSNNIKNIDDPRDVAHWKCPNCLEVCITGTATVTVGKHQTDLWLLSAYYRRQSKLKLPYEILDSLNFEELIDKVKIPKNIHESRARIIEYLGKNAKTIGDYVEYKEYMFLDLVIQKKELEYLIYSLWQQGVIESYMEIREVSLDDYIIDRIRLSPSGWELFDKTISYPIDSNQVFIAMWFNDKTVKLRDSLKAAIIASGYDPIIVDESHFTGNIMDYILSQIKI